MSLPYDNTGKGVTYNGGTGSVPVALDRDAFARMGYRERLALKKENPEVYKELRK